MTLSGVSSSVGSYQTNQSISPTGIEKLFEKLGAALKSGNLSEAKDAFAQLQKNAPAKSAGATGTDPLSSDIDSLGKALDSGDLKAAQDAYSALQSKLPTGQAAGQKAGGNKGAGGDAHSASGAGSQSSSKVYDKMDANKDGKVSAEEKLAYRLKHPDMEKKTPSNTTGSDNSKSSVGTIVDTTA